MRMQVVGVRHHLSARIYLVRFCLYVAREMGHGICTNQEMIVILHTHEQSRLCLKLDAQIHPGSGLLQLMMAH